MVRPRLPVRLVVLDLDGTVLGPDLVVRPRVRIAIAETRARGVPVVIATGRMFRSARRHALALGLRGPLICYQGGYVRELPGVGDAVAHDAGDGRLLYHRPMRRDVARETLDWASAAGLEAHLNVDDELYMARGDVAAPDYERRSGIDAHLVPDLHAVLARRSPTKVLAVGPAGLPERLLVEGRRRFAGRAQVTVSHPEYLEFTAPGVTKGRAVRWLARRMGIPLGTVLAVGDQHNDAEMLELVGHGVAMGGSPAAVRAAARYVTAPYGADGAALALEALVLGRGGLD
ncbi:MAG TPA: Cof-type HAD-IIB family hydrolase [Candidatus Limnocylindrales bacterium]|nr:Cof-type HAD-IIB family hydrolase [Candidatus Limnocylindrales bacterium]